MKITDQNTVSSFENILKIVTSLGIDSIVIRDGTINGINEDKTCVIISENGINIGGLTIGIIRIPQLLNRLNAIKVDDKKPCVLELTEKDGEVQSITVSGQGATTKFRCASTNLLKVPKKLNDEPSFIFTISEDEANMILNGIKVMGGKKVYVILRNGKMSLETFDQQNDVFSVSLSDDPLEVIANSVNNDCINIYDATSFSTVLRLSMKDGCPVTFIIGAQSTMTTTISGHSITLLAQVNNK